MAISWVPLLGQAAADASEIRYIASGGHEGPNGGQKLFAIIKSNVEFVTGEVSFVVALNDPGDACQIVLNHGLQNQIYVGPRGAGYQIALFRDGNWDFLAGSGAGAVPAGRKIAVRVRVRGSEIDLYINDVKVCSALERVHEAQLALLMQSADDFTVSEFRVVTQRPRAFVVMQFSEQFNSLYTDVIRPTCEHFGYEVIRADDVYTSGLIIQDIAREIREASLVIADITPDNPNVFYEVGYAHGIGKTTILLSDRRRDKLPFDVSGFRTLFYDNTIGGKSAVESNLVRHLEHLTA